jgi:hypothetical protein
VYAYLASLRRVVEARPRVSRVRVLQCARRESEATLPSTRIPRECDGEPAPRATRRKSQPNFAKNSRHLLLQAFLSRRLTLHPPRQRAVLYA